MTSEIEFKQLVARVEYLEAVFQVLGVPGLLMTPNQAAKLLNVSPTWIIQEIRLAEELRLINEQPHLKLGVHYESHEGSTSDTPAWKVNVKAFQEFLKQPREARKPSARALDRRNRLHSKPA